MIAKTYIFENLRKIDLEYRKSQNVKSSLLLSKLAIIELCGWIEISMDDLVLRCTKRCLNNNDSHKYVRNDVIKRNYGFDYNRHFRTMLAAVFGLEGFEQLEKKSDQIKIDVLKAELGSLKLERNKQAHTYIKGAMYNIDAPSVSIARFQKIYDGLKEIESSLKKLNKI